ncbi:hypothetical protein [Streptomyces sp. NPDC093589]|uniref:hypothetical protein n=1 Tax=Streptomyces sp. NPDC093589 TaxID=3366043 RepID=UPI0037FDAB27
MATYYRTGKGSHRHASVHCADTRRSIFTGDPVALSAGEAMNWPACEFCCDPAEVAAAAGQAKVKVKDDAKCRNSGVMRPGSRRLYDKCRDCGKEGKVNPGTGALRAHRRQQ